MQEFQKKLEAIFSRVKDPEVGLPLSDVGLVERVRISNSSKTLYVIESDMSNPHLCCSVYTSIVRQQILDELEKELHKEFPDYTVKFIHAGQV